MYEDKTLVCKECGKEFVFTAGEQEFYAERGFQNEPQRCKACRDARKKSKRTPSSVIFWMLPLRPLPSSSPSVCTAWAAPLPVARLWRRPAPFTVWTWTSCWSW